MAKLRVAGAQLPVGGEVAANEAAIGRGIVYAAEKGAAVLLTPEGSLSGYRADFDRDEVQAALARVTAQAQEAGVGLALGTCFEEADGRCYNQLRFYGRDGSYLGFHSKTLTCGSWDDPPKGEINDYAVAPLRTYDLGGVCVGGLICNDLWANPGCTPVPDPHLTQRLAGMGAQVVLHAVNGGRDGSEWSQVAWQFHESNLRMRARAGGLWVVTVDNCAPQGIPCSAPSGVVGPDGQWACKARSQGEDFFSYAIDIGG